MSLTLHLPPTCHVMLLTLRLPPTCHVTPPDPSSSSHLSCHITFPLYPPQVFLLIGDALSDDPATDLIDFSLKNETDHILKTSKRIAAGMAKVRVRVGNLTLVV